MLSGVLGSRSRNNKSLVALEDNQTTHLGTKINNIDPLLFNNTQSEHVNILHYLNITIIVVFNESNSIIYYFIVF